MTIIQIDGSRLRQLISSAGKTMTEVSRSTGYNPNYVSECVHNGTISQAAAKIIEADHGIRLCDYERTEEPEPAVKREPEQMSLAFIDYDALRDAIRDGVVAAWEIIRQDGGAE